MNLQDDDFTLFDLPRQFKQTSAEIDARWRALQSQVHPDRFAAEGAAAQRVAMQWAVRVNEAHQRLKDPLKRGAYLCELRGARVEAENNTTMPSSFLMRQMAWREALDEASDLASVEDIDTQVSSEQDALLASLARALDEQSDAQAAAEQVRALMFVTRFREDLQRRLDAFDL